ncbi:MAG: S8 family serine peptidase, partial [Candidatus Cloacimonas sp.]
MKKPLIVVLMLILLNSVIAVSWQQNMDAAKKLYAIDLLKIKLSAEVFYRANLPTELYAERTNTGINELDQLMAQTGATKIIKAHRKVNDTNWEKQTGFDRWFILKLNGKTTVEEALKQFKANRYVEEAIPEYIAYPAVVPNDTYYTNNWGHNNTAQLPAYTSSGHTGSGVGTVGFDSDAQLAWNQSQGYGSASIIIAIIDTGVDTSHPDLRLVTGYDFGDNDSYPMDNSSDPGHGTACSGIAAGKANNSLGITGIAGGCSIMPLKVANSAGEMYFTAIENALTYAADHNAHIASMSLGATDVVEGDSPSTDTALNYAYNSGVVLFAATGNENNSTISYPANETSVISVGAASPSGQRKSTTSSDGEYWWGSNYGVNTQNNKNAVDIMAPTILPATDLTGTGNGYNTNGDYYLWFNGTSCATPYAAGVAALLLSKDPSLTPAQVFSKLTSNATDMTIDGGVGWDRYTGYGMINANAALNAIVSGMPTCQITSPANGTSFALNSIITINVNATDSNGSIASVKTYINNILYNTDNAAPYSYNWNTTGLTAGSYTIKAVAKDNSNNETISEISISLIQPVSEAIIGTGTSVTGNTAPSPINLWYKSLHGQSVYTKAELNAAGIFGPINITQLGFNIIGLPIVTMPNFVVRLKHTTATNVSSFVTADNLVTVYSNSSYLPTQTGWNMYNFTTPFLWNGTDNLLVDTAFGIASSYNSSGTVQYTSIDIGYHYLINDNSNQTNIFSGGTSSSQRANIKLNVAPYYTGPEITVTPNSLNFGSIPVGESQTRQFTIQNTGDQTLNGTIYTPAGYTVSESTRNNSLNAEKSALNRNTFDITIVAGATQNYALIFSSPSA